MKPTKNRVYCSDCGRIKMLFPSQEKADNFIAFNAHEIISEGYKAPERSYYCSSCGGWHVTKNPNNEYFQEQDLIKNRVPEIKRQIREIVRLFHTGYNKKEVHEWKKKMERLKELCDELDEKSVGLVPEKSMAAKCINQYEQSIERNLKKLIEKQQVVNEVNAGQKAVITSEMTAMFKQLKEACRTLKIEKCIELANILNTELVRAVPEENNHSEIKERLDALSDFLLPQRIDIIKKIFLQTESLLDSCKLMTRDEVSRKILELRELLSIAENSGVAHIHLKGVTNYIVKIEKNLPDGSGGVILKETKEDQAAISESRNKVIEAIDLIKKGEIEQAEQALDVAEALLIGYEDTKDGQQILDALTILNNQIAHRGVSRSEEK
ncbi:MAG: hypothetical protein J6I70_02610 [Bacteroidaceae bacterium]|nr:hypothetical protein [Bacteroidaceae bacterium]